jgi:hypothetical protein
MVFAVKYVPFSMYFAVGRVSAGIVDRWGLDEQDQRDIRIFKYYSSRGIQECVKTKTGSLSVDLKKHRQRSSTGSTVVW